MLILDTCAIIFDALTPERLGKKAALAIERAAAAGNLACCDISWWEIAMLIAKGRLDPGTQAREFIGLVMIARNFAVLAISPEIAVKSSDPALCAHGDPADRIIAASAIIHRAKLVTSDRKLAAIKGLSVIW